MSKKPAKYVIIELTPEYFEGEVKELNTQRETIAKQQDLYAKNEAFFKSKIAWLEGLLNLYNETNILGSAFEALSAIERYKKDEKISPKVLVQKYDAEKEFYKLIIGIYLGVLAPYLEFKERQLRKKREEDTKTAQDIKTMIHGMDQFILGLKRADPR